MRLAGALNILVDYHALATPSHVEAIAAMERWNDGTMKRWNSFGADNSTFGASHQGTKRSIFESAKLPAITVLALRCILPHIYVNSIL